MSNFASPPAELGVYLRLIIGLRAENLSNNNTIRILTNLRGHRHPTSIKNSCLLLKKQLVMLISRWLLQDRIAVAGGIGAGIGGPIGLQLAKKRAKDAPPRNRVHLTATEFEGQD